MQESPLGENEEKLGDGPQELQLDADATVGNLGLAFETLPPLPPAPLIVKQVTDGTWSNAQGVTAGCELVELNGRKANTMSREEFKAAMQERPLRMCIKQPQDEAAREIAILHKKVVRLIWQKVMLQSSLAAEGERVRREVFAELGRQDRLHGGTQKHVLPEESKRKEELEMQRMALEEHQQRSVDELMRTAELMVSAQEQLEEDKQELERLKSELEAERQRLAEDWAASFEMQADLKEEKRCASAEEQAELAKIEAEQQRLTDEAAELAAQRAALDAERQRFFEEEQAEVAKRKAEQERLAEEKVGPALEEKLLAVEELGTEQRCRAADEQADVDRRADQLRLQHGSAELAAESQPPADEETTDPGSKLDAGVGEVQGGKHRPLDRTPRSDKAGKRDLDQFKPEEKQAAAERAASEPRGTEPRSTRSISRPSRSPASPLASRRSSSYAELSASSKAFATMAVALKSTQALRVAIRAKRESHQVAGSSREPSRGASMSYAAAYRKSILQVKAPQTRPAAQHD